MVLKHTGLGWGLTSPGEHWKAVRCNLIAKGKKQSSSGMDHSSWQEGDEPIGWVRGVICNAIGLADATVVVCEVLMVG